MDDSKLPAEKPKRNAPIWVKIFVPLHIVAITAWSLPYAPKQFKPTYRSEWKNGKQVVIVDPPRVPLGIKTTGVFPLFRSTAEYLANEPLVLNEMYVKQSPLKFYLLSTGFWQYWDMFSPNPASIDVYADQVVHFADGTTKLYEYPRMYKLGIPQKYLKERYRKFFERAGNTTYMWPAFAQRIARLNYTDPKNPPVSIDLHMHSMVIAGPGEPQAREYTDQLYYRYVVRAGDLR